MKKIFLSIMAIALIVLCISADNELVRKFRVYVNGEVAYSVDANDVDSAKFEMLPVSVEEGDDESESGMHKGHKYVNLGLPSGLLWATCNVGASLPEETGDYFAWGEVNDKDSYSWETYKYGSLDEEEDTYHFFKYNMNVDFGMIDYKTILDSIDDAAFVNWGGFWRMPTSIEVQELFDNCSIMWVMSNGVNGLRLTGPNGETIFLPAAGFFWGNELLEKGTGGMYWSSSLYYSYVNDEINEGSMGGLFYIVNSEGFIPVAPEERFVGLSVRAVMGNPQIAENRYTVTAVANEDFMGIVTGDGVYNGYRRATLTAIANVGYEFVEWNDGNKENPRTIVVTSDTTFTANFEVRKDSAGIENGHAYVDLGLPSGLLWATCNVGAENPEDYGNYYAWGETETKDNYDWSTYKYGNSATTLTKYNTDSDRGKVDNKTVLDPEDDAAHVNWGGTWRMPTYDEMEELINNCITEWTSINGVYGRKVTSKINSNYIFLPAAGNRGDNGLDSGLDGDGMNGNFWSSSLHSDYSSGAWRLRFYSIRVYGSYFDRYRNRCSGFSVRAVCPQK